ncbi:MAG: hypothetical protein KGP14_00400 [Betaproteobacteria bacterium]|nr:hypothetical protein [Betaproteobacteria bacterium]
MASHPLDTPEAREIERLLLAGYPQSDIELAIITRNAQIANNRPVQSLSVLVGAEQPARETHHNAALVTGLLAKMTPRKSRSGAVHVTGNPVHRSSVALGSDEELAYTEETPDPDFARPLDPKHRKEYENMVHKLCGHAAELRKRDRQRDEEGVEPLTANERRLSDFNKHCRDLMLYLIDSHEFFKGRVFPSLDEIADKIHMSKNTAIRTLKKLRALDFVDWIRRFVTITDKETGTRNEQTSNLYRIRIPNWISDIMQLFRAPIPDDARQLASGRTLDYALTFLKLSQHDRERQVPDPRRRAYLLSIAMESEQRIERERQLRDCQVGTAPHLNLFNISTGETELAWSANESALTGTPKPQPT